MIYYVYLNNTENVIFYANLFKINQLKGHSKNFISNR